MMRPSRRRVGPPLGCYQVGAADIKIIDRERTNGTPIKEPSGDRRARSAQCVANCVDTSGRATLVLGDLSGSRSTRPCNEADILIGEILAERRWILPALCYVTQTGFRYAAFGLIRSVHTTVPLGGWGIRCRCRWCYRDEAPTLGSSVCVVRRSVEIRHRWCPV